MLERFYSVPLWRTSWQDTPWLERLQELSHKQQFTQHPEWRSHGLSDPTFEHSVLAGEPELQTAVLAEAGHYLSAVGSDCRVSLTESWMTNTATGQYAHVHDHKGTSISGVVYVQSHPEAGDLFFPHPHHNLAHTDFLTHDPTHLSIAPTTGTVILFPSWLQHGVRTNTTPHVRISLSFNLKAACG